MDDSLAAAAHAEPIPAATLVVFRERDAGPPELLIVERAKGMAFAGGALVFPGGRIDPGDGALAARYAPDDPNGAARIAAIRETIEEAGIAIGITPMPSADQRAAIRRGLHAGIPFGESLAAHGLACDLSALIAFARWCPRHPNMRIFDTLFFIAALPADAPEPIADATENSRAFWATAQQVLDDADTGAATIIFPTRRNLERLAGYASFADACADAARRPLRTITPWTENRGGIDYLCIPDDLGYPVTAQPIGQARRQ